MSLSLIAVLYGLAGAVGWGVSNFFAAKASRSESAVVTVFNSQLLLFLLMGVIVLVSSGKINFELDTFFVLACTYLSFTIGLILSYKAFAIGPVSITSPIAGSYALVTVLTSTLLFGEVLNESQWIGIIILFIGLILASYKGNSRLMNSNATGIYLAFAALILIGIGISGFVYAIKEIGWVTTVLLGYFFPTFWTGLYLLFKRDFKYLKFNRHVIFLTIFQLMGTIAVSIGVERTISAIVVPVSSVSPILTAILGLIIFKEKIASNNYIGILVIAASLVLLSL